MSFIPSSADPDSVPVVPQPVVEEETASQSLPSSAAAVSALVGNSGSGTGGDVIRMDVDGSNAAAVENTNEAERQQSASSRPKRSIRVPKRNLQVESELVVPKKQKTVAAAKKKIAISPLELGGSCQGYPGVVLGRETPGTAGEYSTTWRNGYFLPGDNVIVKQKGFPWYPAEVMDFDVIAELNPEVKKSFAKGKKGSIKATQILIKYYDDGGSFAVVDLNPLYIRDFWGVGHAEGVNNFKKIVNPSEEVQRAFLVALESHPKPRERAHEEPMTSKAKKAPIVKKTAAARDVKKAEVVVGEVGEEKPLVGGNTAGTTGRKRKTTKRLREAEELRAAKLLPRSSSGGGDGLSKPKSERKPAAAKAADVKIAPGKKLKSVTTSKKRAVKHEVLPKRDAVLEQIVGLGQSLNIFMATGELAEVEKTLTSLDVVPLTLDHLKKCTVGKVVFAARSSTAAGEKGRAMADALYRKWKKMLVNAASSPAELSAPAAVPKTLVSTSSSSSAVPPPEPRTGPAPPLLVEASDGTRVPYVPVPPPGAQENAEGSLSSSVPVAPATPVLKHDGSLVSSAPSAPSGGPQVKHTPPPPPLPQEQADGSLSSSVPAAPVAPVLNHDGSLVSSAPSAPIGGPQVKHTPPPPPLPQEQADGSLSSSVPAAPVAPVLNHDGSLVSSAPSAPSGGPDVLQTPPPLPRENENGSLSSSVLAAQAAPVLNNLGSFVSSAPSGVVGGPEVTNTPPAVGYRR